MSLNKKYIWSNHATTEELSKFFGVTKRRIQQIITEFDSQGLIETNYLVMYIGKGKTTSVLKGLPIYKRIDL